MIEYKLPEPAIHAPFYKEYKTVYQGDYFTAEQMQQAYAAGREQTMVYADKFREAAYLAREAVKALCLSLQQTNCGYRLNGADEAKAIEKAMASRVAYDVAVAQGEKHDV